MRQHYDRIDNSIYHAENDQWWQTDSVLYLLKTSVTGALRTRHAIRLRLCSTVSSSRVGLDTGPTGTFGQIMTSALGTTPATQLAPGEYGALSPPTNLRAFGNGQIPPDVPYLGVTAY